MSEPLRNVSSAHPPAVALDSRSSQPNFARLVPWDEKSWGVEVEFADGFVVAYPVGSKSEGLDHCNKIITDPDFAWRVRWGQQWKEDAVN
jgi:hypothetical protein